jgi:outer membrane protein assembly factor BamB
MCRSFRLLEATLFFILPCAVLPAADWPTFRGPQRTAVSPDTGLLQSWPTEGPPLVWEAQGAGRGYASLAITGGRIYTLGDGSSAADDKDEYLLCFDQASGKLVWKTKTGPAYTSDQPDRQSSRSTPTVQGELVCALTPQGELVCCDTATGAERWRKSLKREFNGKKADSWVYSESVLIDGDQLVCTPGGTQATMVALNKQSGDLLWKCVRENDRGAGHASIVIAEIGGTKVYVQTTGSGALGVRAVDGKLLWSYEIDRTIAVIPTPIVRGDLVFFTAGYKRGGALLKQLPLPDGEIKIEEIYPINPKLANKHGGVVLVGDCLYGDSDDAGLPFCADLLTGEIKWQKRASGKRSAAFAAADGCLYIHFQDGTMVLAKADPAEYKETGSFKVPGSGERPSWSHPVIVDGKLYLREDDRILCYDVKAK